MSNIHSGTKFIGIGTSVPTPENRSSQNNGFQEVYTIDGIIGNYLSSGDYLEIHCANTSEATDITVEQMNFTITEIR